MRTAEQGQKDLIVLVADRHQERTISTLLTKRPQSLGIREVPIDLDIRRHPEHDPVEEVLHCTGKPHSSALFQQLAAQVGLSRCQDSSFRRFREILQG